MVKKECFRRLILTGSLTVALLASATIITPGETYAAGSYSFADTASGTALSGGGASLSGTGLVWYDSDENGKRQIYYRDLTTGEALQITNTPSYKDSPALGGDVIVWEDKRNYAADSYSRDIYGYNVRTREEKKLNDAAGQLVQPSIDGRYVVWHDRNASSNMYAYDLERGTVELIGQGRYPSVAAGKVVYKNAQNGGLSMKDLATGATRSVLELPYHEYADWFAYNGRYVVWKQSNLDHYVKYRMLDTNDPHAVPVDLTQAAKPQREFMQIVIGNDQAAWLEDRGGVAQIMGAQLSKRETYQVTNAASERSLLAFSGDRLVLKGDDGKLVYRSIIRTEVGPTEGGAGGSVGTGTEAGGGGAQPGATPQPTPAAEQSAAGDDLQGSFGPEGGQLLSGDGNARLTIPATAFARSTAVRLQKRGELRAAAEAALPKGTRFVTDPWELTASGAGFRKPAELTFRYPVDQLIPQQFKKMGVYRYDAQTKRWTCIGGVADAASGTIRVGVSREGTYAVMLSERSFPDIAQHWARMTIEIAASRGLADGMEDERFHPDDTLTRAQFTKLLAGAIGLEPEQAEGSSFGDVPASHWGSGWIASAVKAGLVQGADDGTFRPDAAMTREQMVAMLIRAVGAEQEAQALGEGEMSAYLSYRDADRIGAWARPYMAMAVKLGFVQGDEQGNVLPDQSSTRAQAVVVIFRLLTKQQLI